MLDVQFLLQGGIFTIELPEDLAKAKGRTHETYCVERVPATDKWPEAHFVKVLRKGGDTENPKDFIYVGKLDTFIGQVLMTAKSAFGSESFRVRILNRVLVRVWCNDHEAYQRHGFKVYVGEFKKCMQNTPCIQHDLPLRYRDLVFFN